MVYCNFLEHLLLHIKIVELPRHADANEHEIPGIGGAVNLISRQLNDFYNGVIFTNYLSDPCNIVKNDYNSYIKMLNYLWKIIKNHPLYSKMYTKEDLSKNWNEEIIQKILKDIVD